MKKSMDIAYPEAYAELQALCNDYFPSDPAFYEKAKDMNKTLFHLNGTDFPRVSSLIISSAVRSLRNRMREISCRRFTIFLSEIS